MHRFLFLFVLLQIASSSLFAQHRKIDFSKCDTMVFKNRQDTLLMSTDSLKINQFLNFINENVKKDKGENYKSWNFLTFYLIENESRFKLEIFGDGFRYNRKRYKVDGLREEFKNVFGYQEDIK